MIQRQRCLAWTARLSAYTMSTEVSLVEPLFNFLRFASLLYALDKAESSTPGC